MKTLTNNTLFALVLILIGLQGCKKEATPIPIPVADFTWAALSGGTIQFTDKSTSAITYAWDFGDGKTSTEKSPKYVYGFNGTYLAKLTVTNATGNNSIEKTVTVTNGTNPVLTADFSFALLANGDVQFTNKSTGGTGTKTYKWDFGYGQTSTDKDPKVSLVYNGDYKVTLIASDGSFGTKTVEKVVAVANGKAVPTASDEFSTAKGTSGGEYYSYRNHFYIFEVTEDNKNVTANIQSADIDVAFYWYDNLGQDLDRYGQFSGPTANRNFTNSKKLNKGKYTLLVVTKNRYEIGKYNLTIRGIDASPVRVASTTLKDNKDFGDGGGGSTNFFSEYLSPRNKLYTFEVLEDNTYVDIDVSSNNADTWVKLFNSLNQSQNLIRGGRRDFQNLKCDKGIYTLLVGTVENLVKTNYNLEINGKVSKLTEKVAKVLKVDDKWSGNLVVVDGRDFSFDNYTFDITEDNTWIEITSISSDVNNRTNIYNSSGQEVSSNPFNTDKICRQTFKVSKGAYKIYLRGFSKSTAAYSMSVIGQVANLKKL